MHEGRIRGLLKRLRNLSRKEDALVQERVGVEKEIQELRGLRDRNIELHDMAKYVALEKELVDQQAKRVKEVLRRPPPGRDYREQQQAMLREQAARGKPTATLPDPPITGTGEPPAPPVPPVPPVPSGDAAVTPEPAPPVKKPNGSHKKKAREE